MEISRFNVIVKLQELYLYFESDTHKIYINRFGEFIKIVKYSYYLLGLYSYAYIIYR